jgi:Big-like domain-containing protein
MPTQTSIGDTHVGSPTDKTIAVTNLGDASQHVTAVSLGGANAGEFAIHDDGCSGEDIPAGGSCDIVVRALPTQAGTSSAIVTVTSDAFDAKISGAVSQSATNATSVSLAGNSTTAAAGTNVVVHAAATPTDGGGSVEFYVDGKWAGSGIVDDTGKASASLQPQPVGTHDLVAHYIPQQGHGYDVSESDPLTIDFLQPTYVTLTSDHNPVLTGAQVTLTATAIASVPPSGTLTITDATTSTVLASGPVGGSATKVEVTTTFSAAGTHVIRADLASGDPDYLDSTTTIEQAVGLDDFVAANGFALSIPTIYPVKDGYRDTVAVKGARQETASVAVTVTSSGTGKVVARGSVPAGVGPYQWLWNGRTAGGAILPAGTYVISQVVTDSQGNQLGWSKSITLSTKKLVTLTWSKTQYGNQFQSFGRSGNGTVTKRSSPYPNEVRLDASTPGWAAAEWSFTLPAATVSNRLRFFVNGSASGTAEICVWHPAFGSYLNLAAYDCPDFVRGSHATYAVQVSPASHISARHVHGLVYVGTPYSRGIANVAWVKVVFTYGVLR